LIAPLVVVIDGSAIVSSQPPTLDRGVVRVPLDPFMRRLASRIDVDNSTCTVTFAKNGRNVVLSFGARPTRSPYLREGEARIPLAYVARRLGYEVSYDARARVVTVLSPPAEPVASMVPAPGDGAPPSVIFAPSAPATPRPVVTGVPLPRRTPTDERPSRP
jgi:hypothetical protein